jgi:hypothetical protein
VEPRQRYSPTTVSPEVPLAAPYRSSAPEVTRAVSDQFVEVSARIPVGVPSVTIRVEIGQPTTSPSVIPNRVATATLGAGRELPALAFVTDPDKLSRKIGSDGYRNVADLIQTSGKLLLECDSAAPYETVRRSGKAVSGVVVLGDYDVMPGAIHDALPLDIRHEIEDEIEDDADEFIVWSDHRYGMLNGDEFADIPVSRIPDCSSADFLIRSLCADDRRGRESKFAVRNSKRPFAEGLFPHVPGIGRLEVSGPFTSRMPSAADYESGMQYYMLHGSSRDGTRFWGEDGHCAVEASQHTGYPLLRGSNDSHGVLLGSIDYPGNGSCHIARGESDTARSASFSSLAYASEWRSGLYRLHRLALLSSVGTI